MSFKKIETECVGDNWKEVFDLARKALEKNGVKTHNVSGVQIQSDFVEVHEFFEFEKKEV